MMGDQLGDDLGVGLALEGDALRFELPLECGVILDDPIVDDGHLSLAADVGMGIAVIGGPMRRPASVADPDTPGHGTIAEQTGQVMDAPGRLAEVQMGTEDRRQTGAVIAAILETPQSLDEDWFRFLVTGVADDAAHGVP